MKYVNIGSDLEYDLLGIKSAHCSFREVTCKLTFGNTLIIHGPEYVSYFNSFMTDADRCVLYFDSNRVEDQDNYIEFMNAEGDTTIFL